MSEIVSPYTFDTISDECRIFKVKGVVLDNRGIPFGQAISQTKVISNTLMAGTCPIMRNGRVHGSVEKSTKRRPSTATKVVDNNNNTNLRQTMTTNPLNEPVNSDSDLPVTFQQENSFDWSVCKPLHRQTTVVELENSQFAVTIAGEPCVWIFSRKSPAEIANVGSSYRGSRHMSIGQLNDQYFPSNRHDSSRIGGIVYLLEVQYYFKIVTGHVSSLYSASSLNT